MPREATKPYPGYPGWTDITCYCSGGIVWNYHIEGPDDCNTCQGNGGYARHDKSGALALYPGGPFIGQETPVAGPTEEAGE